LASRCGFSIFLIVPYPREWPEKQQPKETNTMEKKINFKNTNNPGITMSALINFPDGFNERK
jgi:hypothetical protein